ncbi:hypothetical protein SEA_TINYMINY_81 [Microbacterium phage TinyMiny]|nr:hypothetical protein SEA_TINYMINY_81 [Microbacterium phage TinyMiny]
MSESYMPCDGHRHPVFLCLCGQEIALLNIVIPYDNNPW